MSDHTVIAILVGALALLSGGLGYGLGEQRRHRDETTQQTHYLEGQIEEHERRLRAHGALIEVIAEDYDPPAQDEQSRRRKLPEGWRIINGGALVLLFAGTATWLRKHWRDVATALASSGVTAAVAVALLTHGAPPSRPQIARPAPSPGTTTQTAYATPPSPTTKPGRTPRRVLPPPPVIPTRRKPAPTQAAGSPAGAPPPPRPSPSRSPTPPQRTPTHSPSPSPTCPVGVAVHLAGIGVTICV